MGRKKNVKGQQQQQGCIKKIQRNLISAYCYVIVLCSLEKPFKNKNPVQHIHQIKDVYVAFDVAIARGMAVDRPAQYPVCDSTMLFESCDGRRRQCFSCGVARLVLQVRKGGRTAFRTICVCENGCLM